ncbi:hypothetical protein Lsan_1916 [Legionella santicrucis]|uniref:DUF4116 domain-containing protein n=1 Tax=Legionella santicrucis TaxID=45074 RepID=A0A0W0YW39_9GAMM|nr:DUF4116 domain-containing protein [Legionella santicrucis]KTD60911.1 hypothetical protein Lsan_1916 [Legionella santicrucis]
MYTQFANDSERLIHPQGKKINANLMKSIFNNQLSDLEISVLKKGMSAFSIEDDSVSNKYRLFVCLLLSDEFLAEEESLINFASERLGLTIQQIAEAALLSGQLNLVNKLSSQSNGLSAEDYVKICLAVVQNNGSALQYVRSDGLSKDDYAKICLAAVQNDSWALEYVKSDRLSREDYAKICLAAVQNENWAIGYINVDGLNNDDYGKICLVAVQNEGLTLPLQYVNSNVLGKKDYAKICLAAVQNKGEALQDVKSDDLNKVDYAKICLAAVQNKGEALQDVKSDDLNKEDYAKICLAAVQNNSRALQYIKSDGLSKEDYASIHLDCWTQRHQFSELFPTDVLKEFIKEKKIALDLIKSNYGVFDKLPPESKKEVNKIKLEMAKYCQTIIVKLDDDYEMEDTYRIYAVKHADSYPVCIRTKEQLQELLLFISKNGLNNSINVAIIGHSNLKSNEIASFSSQDLTQLKKSYPFIKKFTLIGCDTAGDKSILPAEAAKLELLKKGIQSSLISQYPQLREDTLRLDELATAILTDSYPSRCGLAVINKEMDELTLKHQFPETLDAAYMLVQNKNGSSYSVHYIHRGTNGVQSELICPTLSEFQLQQLKDLNFTINTKKPDGYRLKNKQFISKKDYDQLNNEERSKIEAQLLRDKKGKPVPNLIPTKKSIFDEVDITIWAQSNTGKIALLDDQVRKKIMFTTKHKTEFKERDYNTKQNNEDKPIHAQHITISSENEDFFKMGECLVTRVVNAMKQEGVKDVVIKGYRSLLYPSPSEEQPNTGRLYGINSHENIFRSAYSQTFFGSNKTTNLNLEKLRDCQIKATEEGRTKAVNVFL